MTNPNDPISPLPVEHITAGMTTAQASGLTKREHFAALAMQGFCASQAGSQQSAKMIAGWSIEQADALIIQLKKPALNASEEKGAAE